MNTIELFHTNKKIYDINLAQNNINNSTRLDFTNYYMTLDQKPFFGISAEFHFSRYHESKWEDEIIKIKMSGVNIISTYVIWNHHEELKNKFIWEERFNLNDFVRLCARHNIFVILRIGPFCHGEIRNGGLPDWLFGEPCQIRSNDPKYLVLVEHLYSEIGKQVKNLFFKDGGPIIAVQLENEFGHASAPWELTTGTSNEWCSTGTDGYEHIYNLKKIAIRHGIMPAFYTGTGWGGAYADPDVVLPLWGGYAYWPWIFYGDVQEHPLTPEFIYRDFHNNNTPETYNFTPLYKPETVPYACCEMGGGMTVFYNYRFSLPYKSIDAMSNIKIAGGCNFIGYYVYHGGSNPTGIATTYLNETVTPKISYDYQAAIGEFGQIRSSYQRLKRLHYFLNEFSESLCTMKTILPDNSQTINPNDLDTIRYAVRIADRSGFIFINNFQDHIENKDTDEFDITLKLLDEKIEIKSLVLKKEENCILPFNLKIGSAKLKYSTTQLITKTNRDGIDKYIFFIPDGMSGDYFFEKQSLHPDMATENDEDLVKFTAKPYHHLIDSNGVHFELITLSAAESENIWSFDFLGEREIVFTSDTLLSDSKSLKIESSQQKVCLELLDGLHSSALEHILNKSAEAINVGNKKTYIIHNPAIINTMDLDFIHNNRGCLVDIDPEIFKNTKEVLLSIEYDGDIGYCFINNELIHDNYNNNTPWVIGLSQHSDKLDNNKIFIKISPCKENSSVKSDSPMAARSETIKNEIANIRKIILTPVYEYIL